MRPSLAPNATFSSQPNRDDGALSMRPIGRHGLAHRGGYLVGEELDLAHVVLLGPVDECVHAEIEGEAAERLDPLRGGAVEGAVACLSDSAGDVDHAPDLRRPSAGAFGGIVYALLHRGYPLRG